MALADLLTARIPRSRVAPGEKPRDDEIDLFGLTHPGKVRKENQDHFLVATVHPQVVIHGTSLPEPDRLAMRGQRFGSIMLVADGVGGSVAGKEASRIAVETIAQYVTSTLRCYHASGSNDKAEVEFLESLRSAALEAHSAVKAEAVTREQSAERTGTGMATTLTLAAFVWPWMYVVQVGDSRCYYYWDGELRQVTRDQTLAQDLVDQGVLPRDRAAASPFSHVLASAIGGQAASPVVTRIDISHRGAVILLCSDGLTKHVADPEIADHIRSMTSSEQLCHALLDLALERGGSDNVTVLAARAPLLATP
jgi:serine/threonine protein phosphatase PrpC